MKENVTITVPSTLVEVMRDYYKDSLVNSQGEYVDFQANLNGIIITAYLSKKENRKVTFFGDNALLEAKVWDLEVEIKEKKETVKEGWLFFGDQIGSDEVGVGDFLGPMIVVAAFVKQSDINKLIALGIHDSKKMTDKKILEVGPEIVKQFKFSKLTLSNEKYNEMLEKGENLNSMKAKMHNRALYNLVNKHPEVVGVYVDQFVPKEKFYEYLNDPDERVVRDISFMTKGESIYPSVAAASIIARYAFLLEMETLNEKYDVKIPFGAGSKVNEFAKDFIARYGILEFNKIAKKNFANYKEVISIKLA